MFEWKVRILAMRKIDTLFYFPKKGKPLQPIIEEFLIEGGIRVSIMPGFVICPNLKQKFVPIEKKEFFTCKGGDAFYLVIDEIVSDLKIKEKQTFRFYPTIKPEHETGWILPYTSVSYLETLFELDFNEIYYSFRKKINF